ncbi:hypothetical protein RZN25_15890 [Bacillaceae bacterium S4-13-56]
MEIISEGVNVDFLLQVLASVILLIGIFAAFAVDDFMVVFSTFVFVMIVFGLAEIIHILHNIFYQLKDEKDDAGDRNETSLDQWFHTIIPLNEQEKDNVYKLFEHQKKRDINIISSPIKQHCIVSVKNAVYVDEAEVEILNKAPEGSGEWAKEKKGITL